MSEAVTFYVIVLHDVLGITGIPECDVYALMAHIGWCMYSAYAQTPAETDMFLPTYSCFHLRCLAVP